MSNISGPIKGGEGGGVDTSVVTSIIGQTELDQLFDVSAPTPLDSQALVWSSVKNQWVNQTISGSGGISQLTSAIDVTVSGAAANGDMFIYRTSDNKFHVETVDYALNSSVNAVLQQYVTSASLLTALGPYITSASAVTLVAPYVTSASLVTALSPYVTSASVLTALGSYVTNSSLTTALAPYITSASVNTLLGSYLTSASASSAYASVGYRPPLSQVVGVSLSAPTDLQVLAYSSSRAQWINRQILTSDISGIDSYVTSTSLTTALGSYVTNSSLTTALAPYVTSASLVTALGPYATSASIVTLLGSYLTSASASSAYASVGYRPPLSQVIGVSLSSPTDLQVLAYSSAASQWVNRQLSTSDISGLGAYITSASLTTALTPYVTSASLVTALGPYITSASASAAFSSVAHTHTLDNLSDVSVVSPTDGHVLVWSSTASQWVAQAVAGGSGITAILSATDVSVSSAVEGQFLTYNSVTQEWQNRTIDVVTSASLNTLLGTYVTSASLATALGPYLTSASAATVYITSASVSTMVSVQISAKVDSIPTAVSGASRITNIMSLTSAQYVAASLSINSSTLYFITT